MVLIVEDGTGLATAESYSSEADADTYNTAYVGDGTWTAATSGAKEVALRQATQYLDLVYGNKWHGTRKTEAQALAWPRTGVKDCDGYLIDDDSLPINLVRATAELAIKAIANTLLVDPDNSGGIKRLKQIVGPLEEETEYFSPGADATAVQTQYTTVSKLLFSACLITGGNSFDRA